MHHHTRIVWETHWELEVRMQRSRSLAERSALRMLLLLRRDDSLTDHEIAAAIGRSAHEVWQWWRVYEREGLLELLETADRSPWLSITGAAVPQPIEHQALPFGVRFDGSVEGI